MKITAGAAPGFEHRNRPAERGGEFAEDLAKPLVPRRSHLDFIIFAIGVPLIAIARAQIFFRQFDVHRKTVKAPQTAEVWGKVLFFGIVSASIPARAGP